MFLLLCSWRVEGICYWSTWRMSNLNSWSALSSELQTRCRIPSVVWPTRLILCKIPSKMYEFIHAETAWTNTQVHVWLVVEKPHKKKYLVVRRCTLMLLSNLLLKSILYFWEQVVEAMRQTVTNMLGTLPPQFFDVRVSTVCEQHHVFCRHLYGCMCFWVFFVENFCLWKDFIVRLQLQLHYADFWIFRWNCRFVFRWVFCLNFQVWTSVVWWIYEGGLKSFLFYYRLQRTWLSLCIVLWWRAICSEMLNTVLSYNKAWPRQLFQTATTFQWASSSKSRWHINEQACYWISLVLDVVICLCLCHTCSWLEFQVGGNVKELCLFCWWELGFLPADWVHICSWSAKDKSEWGGIEMA
jgi:hypothetical protein